MKQLVYILGGLLLAICILFGFQIDKNEKLQSKYEISVNNNKAYEMQLNDQSIAFQFTVEQLNYINDQNVKQLDSMRTELGIKDKKIKQMSKVKEYVYVHDSITVHDTLFPELDFCFDTCLTDKWRNVCIGLQYPNLIDVCTEMNLDQDCFVHKERETINPPCKTWIGRLFQKKHDVYHVTVIEHNPYANIKENKFIIIQ